MVFKKIVVIIFGLQLSFVAQGIAMDYDQQLILKGEKVLLEYQRDMSLAFKYLKKELDEMNLRLAILNSEFRANDKELLALREKIKKCERESSLDTDHLNSLQQIKNKRLNEERNKTAQKERIEALFKTIDKTIGEEIKEKMSREFFCGDEQRAVRKLVSAFNILCDKGKVMHLITWTS